MEICPAERIKHSLTHFLCEMHHSETPNWSQKQSQTRYTSILSKHDDG